MASSAKHACKCTSAGCVGRLGGEVGAVTHTVEIAKTFGTDLSSRQRAAALRLDITSQTAAGITPVTLDFAGVRTVSESFADGAIAVLVAERGEEWFRQNVRLVNLSPFVRLSVLEAVDERCRCTEASGA
ncbi:MAG: DUF4325 domain-containing protein [Betaproteobacteria bacterium]|nr:DUF4325 domain-containing protein [Betaproteobacteria bacterium]